MPRLGAAAMFLLGWGRLWGSGHGGDPHLRFQCPTGAIGDLPASRFALPCLAVPAAGDASRERWCVGGGRAAE
eukprot:8312380-Alexandrium_andersonii.AAC.2